MTFFEIKYSTLCAWLWSNSSKQKNKIDILMDKIKSEYSFSKEQLAQIKNKLLEIFLPVYIRNWNSTSRTQRVFRQKYTDFIDKMLQVTFTSSNTHKDSTPKPLNLTSIIKRGRPKLSLESCSDRTKRRRIQELRNHYNEEEIAKANARNRKNQSVPKMTNKDANDMLLNRTLAMYMDLGLSKAKYETLRDYNLLLFNSKNYPPYDKLRTAKENCYPKDIQISEHGASVKLQSLLDHTVRRIVESLSTSTSDFNFENGSEYILYGKWEMDGASGQQIFKQKWVTDNSKTAVEVEEDPSSEELSDQSIFIISYVPLQISSRNNKILWANNRPSSVRYCHPIKYIFMKETPSKTKQEYNYYTNEIKNLIPTTVTANDVSFTVGYNLQCTMIDGKVCNVLTGQKSSSSCNICGAKPTEMNNLDRVTILKANDENCKFGLSTLHCWIRFMECLLHISYNLKFKKGYASGENKILKEKRKQEIQTALKSELSISVDFVKQGFGTTNDGNTARSFFSEPDVVGRILGIDVILIRRFANILHVMSSGFEVDIDKFEVYAFETTKLYVKNYDWYKMPPAVHKVLIHGKKIMQQFNLPIGRLSEEAQEANNKVFKSARAHNSRCCSRKDNNEDIMHYLLIASDPLISSLRTKKEKKIKQLSEEAKSLLKNSITQCE